MVVHTLWYRQTYTYLGVLEALPGLPMDVEFLSFDDVCDSLVPDVKVLICAGAEGTTFSGGEQWTGVELVAQVSSFVVIGDSLIGVGVPSAHPAHGVIFRLADVLGVDQGIGWGLSMRRCPPEVEEHFIARNLTGGPDDDEGTPDIAVTSPVTRVLDVTDGQVHPAAHELGGGRTVCATGLPYSAQNPRLLYRAIFWATGCQEDFSAWTAFDPGMEVATYPGGRTTPVINNSLEPVTTTVPILQGPRMARLEEGRHQWLTVALQWTPLFHIHAPFTGAHPQHRQHQQFPVTAPPRPHFFRQTPNLLNDEEGNLHKETRTGHLVARLRDAHRRLLCHDRLIRPGLLRRRRPLPVPSARR